MNSEELIGHAKRLVDEVNSDRNNGFRLKAIQLEACELLRLSDFSKSHFYSALTSLSGGNNSSAIRLVSILTSFSDFISQGLYQGISPERQGQLDVVSDLLEQAQNLLENKKVHPAAPAVLIGATLEEYLRTWIENENVSLGNKKPSLDAYAKTLREEDRITKQDVKDITSWAGIRNHAAHGEWDEVSDRNRIRLMLEGVNLFMRKYNN